MNLPNIPVKTDKSIFHYDKQYTEKQICIRCGGTRKANPLTYPEQVNCCGLCRGKGTTLNIIVPVTNLS